MFVSRTSSTTPSFLGSDEVMISRALVHLPQKKCFSSVGQKMAGMNGSVLCPHHTCRVRQDCPLGSGDPLTYRSSVPDGAVPEHNQSPFGVGVSNA